MWAGWAGKNEIELLRTNILQFNASKVSRKNSNWFVAIQVSGNCLEIFALFPEFLQGQMTDYLFPAPSRSEYLLQKCQSPLESNGFLLTYDILWFLLNGLQAEFHLVSFGNLSLIDS